MTRNDSNNESAAHKLPLTSASARSRKKTGARAGSTCFASDSFPIVGVGASAGGLEAFTELLKHLPPDTGLAFVLVQHLDPQHESVLTQLLTRTASMPVREVTHNLRVEANHVYVIPPKKNLGIEQGVLKLQPLQRTRTPARSIDSFLEALAKDRRERAIGVILSGTASDGTLGLEAVKAEGGITFAQDDSARYDSMPRSAMAAGCVDFVLSPEHIAKELARIAKHPYVAGRAPEFLTPLEMESGIPGDETPLPIRGDGEPATKTKATSAPPPPARGAAAEPASRDAQNGYKQVLALLQNHSGVDFSLYKSTTIQRRIQRRMVLNKQDTLENYADFLRCHAKELDALYSDALISVTGFFRNPEAFAVLKQKVFPKLLQQRDDEPLRVWVLGCSTGQEAYSIAMSFAESAEKAHRARKLQVFATDLNDALLDKARHGLYAKTLAQDVSPERLRRFFVEEEGGYRVIKTLREQVVFARQNLIGDPPFSRMDLISCRNLMIYLEPSLQKKALFTFHYALKPKGFLFLGTSESVGGFTDLFEPVDKKNKIFAKKNAANPAFHLSVRGESGERRFTGQKRLPAEKRRAAPEGFHPELVAQREADRITVNQFAPPGVLINADLQILQFRGPTGAYLQPPPTGNASFDVLKMAQEGLMLPLRSVINKAKKEGQTAYKNGVRIKQNGKTRTVNLEVVPLKNLRERCFLVLFKDAEKATDPGPSAPSPEPPSGAIKAPRRASKREQSRRITDLEQELSETRDYLQSVQEQHEAANEELQASNEEIQSANEELQSINEELETSKEELESTNEELLTVNDEMTHRNAELNRLNSDLTNLQTSTKLVIVLLGRDLAIRRFSPQAEKQFNLLATDVGRPINQVRHNLDLPDLEAVVAEVIASMREYESDVRDRDGRWYSLRVRPYLTLDNKVDGAVLVLVSIDQLKRAQQALAEAHEHATAIIRTVPNPLVILDADLRVRSANDAFYRIFKLSSWLVEGRPLLELDHGSWNDPKLRQLLEDILPRNSFFNDFDFTHNFERIGLRSLLLNARMLNESGGKPKEILLGIQDITEVLAFQADLRRSELRYRRLFESAHDGVLLLDATTGKILDANPFMSELLGYTREELRGRELYEIGLLSDRAASESAFKELQNKGHIRYQNLPLQTKIGTRCEVEFISNLYHEDGEKIIQCNVRDIAERKKVEDNLIQAGAELADRAGQLEHIVTERTAELTTANKQLEAFIYTIAHDLRAPLRSMQDFSAMLVEEAGPTLNANGKDYAERIDKSAQFMDSLLSDLLAFSRVGYQQVGLSEVNLEPVVESVLARLQKDIEEKNARVENLGPWPVVLAHEPTLAQVLFNLASNALKFAAPGTPPLVRLRTEERAEFIRVWVEDNGIGVAPEHHDQVFLLFTRLHGEKYPGTGTGLAIVQKGVERMRGTVGLESDPGQGNRFWFELRKA